jgi:acyl carrier protein
LTDNQSIRDKVRTFILDEFLPGDDTELMTTGILDSLSTLKLITYLEKEFDITVEAHEADAENLNTVADITGFVSSKLG